MRYTAEWSTRVAGLVGNNPAFVGVIQGVLKDLVAGWESCGDVGPASSLCYDQGLVFRAVVTGVANKRLSAVGLPVGLALVVSAVFRRELAETPEAVIEAMVNEILSDAHRRLAGDAENDQAAD